MRWLSVILATVVTVLVVRPAEAQSFFGGGVVAFDPEISTVPSGTVLDAQATVSHDRKYVTITMQPQQSRLLALQPFVVQEAIAPGQVLGFVGGAMPTGDAPAPASGDSVAPVSNSPEDIERRAIAARSILSQRGMFLLRAN